MLDKIIDRLGCRFNEAKRVLNYLVHYGYLHPLVQFDLPAIATAIRQFREMAGLGPNDGFFTQDILIKTQEKRCGCSDVMKLETAEARWRKNNLKYYVANYVNGLSQADQDNIIDHAWMQWEAFANIQLVQTRNQSEADIIISTGRGAGQNFDGPSGTLAWAYLPQGNDSQLLMRFDLDETWIKSANDRGILMLNVACHEFGHLLGLEHSRVSSALMAPYYSPAISAPQTNDDIPRIQALYGKATTPTPTPTPSDVIVNLEVNVTKKTAKVL